MDKISRRFLRLIGANAPGADTSKLLQVLARMESMPPEEIAEWLSTEEGAAALAWIPVPRMQATPKLQKFADVIPAKPGTRHSRSKP